MTVRRRRRRRRRIGTKSKGTNEKERSLSNGDYDELRGQLRMFNLSVVESFQKGKM